MTSNSAIRFLFNSMFKYIYYATIFYLSILCMHACILVERLVVMAEVFILLNNLSMFIDL